MAAVEWESFASSVAVEEPHAEVGFPATIPTHEAVSPTATDTSRHARLAEIAILVMFMVIGIESWHHSDWFVRPKETRIASVAVLPIQDLSASGTEDYFADGIMQSVFSPAARRRGARE